MAKPRQGMGRGLEAILSASAGQTTAREDELRQLPVLEETVHHLPELRVMRHAALDHRSRQHRGAVVVGDAVQLGLVPREILQPPALALGQVEVFEVRIHRGGICGPLVTAGSPLGTERLASQQACPLCNVHASREGVLHFARARCAVASEHA